MSTQPITEARVRRALVAAAYTVTTHGQAYAPIFERLEREMEMMERRQDPLSRAQRVLAAHLDTPQALLIPPPEI